MKTIFVSLITVFILSSPLQADSEETAYLAMGPGGSISNRTIDATGSDYGIDISGASGIRTLTNISVIGAKKGGVRISGEGVVVKISGGSFSHNKQFGIHVRDNARVTIDGASFIGNGAEPLSPCDGGDHNLCNHGIYATASSTVSVYNSKFENNGIAGIWASDLRTFVRVEKSEFTGNAIGYFGAIGSILKMFDSDIYRNNRAGNVYNGKWGAEGGVGLWINNRRTRAYLSDVRIREHKFCGVVNTTRDDELARNEFKDSLIRIKDSVIYNNAVGIHDWEERMVLEGVTLRHNRTGLLMGVAMDARTYIPTTELHTVKFSGDGVLFYKNSSADIIARGRNPVEAKFTNTQFNPYKVIVQKGNTVTINDITFLPNYTLPKPSKPKNPFKKYKGKTK